MTVHVLRRPGQAPADDLARRSEVGTFARSRSDRMRAVMQRHVGSGSMPGLVLLVRQGDREYMQAIGTLAFDTNAPMQRDTIFRLASTTKPITAVAAMTLVEECRLRLDDPVDEWLPELTNRRVLRTVESPLDDTVPANRPITLRDLLTFRSGYGEVAFLSPTSPLQQALAANELPLSTWPFPGTPDEFMRRLGSLPLAFQPGERWLYHMGSEIVGVLIARVSGKTLEAFLRERIFEPLGMKDTAFSVPGTKIGRLATCYGTRFPETELVVLEDEYSARPPLFESGAGGLVSTADDLLAFGQMMLDRGTYRGHRILSRAAVEVMTTDQLTPGQKSLSPFFEGFWDSRGWGLGMSVVTRSIDLAEVPGRYGWDGAFGTSWYVDPRNKVIGVLMTQRRPHVPAIPPVVRDFWTGVYQWIDE